MNEFRKMKKKQVSLLGDEDEGRFITAIHNYCDRWCEKCSFTERCSVFAMEKEYELKHPDKKNDPDSFLEHVADILTETLVMLRKMADEKGIDLTSVEDAPRVKRHRQNHPIINKSKKYGFEINDWLKANNDRINAEINQLMQLNEEKAGLLFEAFETVSWFSFFISVKFSRAFLHSKDDEYASFDRLGSAKIALLATERSIASLAMILQYLPDEEDNLLNFLVVLEKVKNSALKAFPGAMDFIRPGFDEYVTEAH